MCSGRFTDYGFCFLFCVLLLRLCVCGCVFVKLCLIKVSSAELQSYELLNKIYLFKFFFAIFFPSVQFNTCNLKKKEKKLLMQMQ